MDDGCIDVDSISKEVLEEIKENGFVDDLPSFKEVNLNMVKSAASSIRSINHGSVRPTDSSSSHFIDFQQTELYMSEIDAELQAMDSVRENYAFRRIYSCRKIIGPLILFCKRVVRKLLKWYIEPVCFQQTDFNNAVTPAMDRMSDVLYELIKGQKETYSKIEEYNALLQSIKTKVDENKIANEKEFLRQRDDIRKMQMTVSPGEENNFWEKITVSQSGEDAIIAYILDSLKISAESCTYLDLGANHAKDLSNTYYFYKKGARGVLVEANPLLIPELELMRNRDVVLNKCISSTGGQTVDFYVLSGDGLSTASKAEVDIALQKNSSLHVEKVVTVGTITVDEIIEKYLHCAPVLLNLDVEGMEMDILKSIDFSTVRPLVIVVETVPYEAHLFVDKRKEEIIRFMREQNYAEYAFTGINSIFVDKKQLFQDNEVIESSSGRNKA